MSIATPGATGNRVVGNYIGTDATGTGDLGNSGNGVWIRQYAWGNFVGGTTGAARNVISGNDGGGVLVFGWPGAHNRILSNSVYANGFLGIDLSGDGSTANDPGDTDKGANDLQNFPVLSTAKTVSGQTTIRGTLNSIPNEVYVIQFFSNPNGTRQGKTLLGQTTLTTDAAGNASFAFNPTQAVTVGRAITATATGNPSGARNTSEFSEPRRVTS